MSNRKLSIRSKKLFFLNIVFFLIARTSIAHAGLVDLYHLKTKDGKSIILAGDKHSINDFQEIMDMIELISKQEQGKKSIKVLVEQVLNNEHTTSFSSCMLESLPKLLEIDHLDKTVMRNIEIRAVSNAIGSLLSADIDLDMLSANSFFQNGTSSPKTMVDDVTFQHLYDEYNCLKQAFSASYTKYDDECIQQLFEQQMDQVHMYYMQLQYILNKWKDLYGISESEPIISLVKKLKEAELIHFPNQAEDKKHLTLGEKLKVYIRRVFIPLFNINAFDHIMQQKVSSDIVLLVSGAAHTRVMKDWLSSCHEANEVLVESNNDDSDSQVARDTVVARLAAILHIENPAIAAI